MIAGCQRGLEGLWAANNLHRTAEYQNVITS